MLSFSGIILLVLVGGVTFVMVGALGGSGVLYLLRRRQVVKAASRDIATLGDDTDSCVRLSGEVRAGDGGPIEAPATRRPCVAWSLVIEERREPEWISQQTIGSDVGFEIRDASGAAVVRPANALWSLSAAPRTVAADDLDAARVAELLPAGAELPKRHSWRVSERIVVDGDTLVVVGAAGGGVVAHRRGRPLVISDGDSAAVVDELRGRAIAAILFSAVLVVAVGVYVVTTLMGLPS